MLHLIQESGRNSYYILDDSRDNYHGYWAEDIPYAIYDYDSLGEQHYDLKLESLEVFLDEFDATLLLSFTDITNLANNHPELFI
jgi:hypothetical protein